MNESKTIIIIIILIIILLFIDYFHNQYRFKRSIKKVSYRNSHSYYDDTDYAKYQPYAKTYTYKYLIIFLSIILIVEIVSNLDNLSNNTYSNNLNNLNNNLFYFSDESKQYEIGTYHKNYSKRIESLQQLDKEMLSQDSFDYYSEGQIKQQISFINSIILEYDNYKANELESSLHNINIQKLYLLKNKFEIAAELKSNTYNNELINSLNSINHDLNKASNDYRIEIIRIFNNINMNYNIDENGIIEFTYKE